MPTDARAFTARGGVVDSYEGGIAALFPGVGMTKSEFTYERRAGRPMASRECLLACRRDLGLTGATGRRPEAGRGSELFNAH